MSDQIIIDETTVDCPVCGSISTRVDRVTFGNGFAIAECLCRDCTSDWNEVYRFEKVEEVYDAREE